MGGVYDVAVIGGGIVGASAAAFLAEAGASVVLLEGTAVAAGASGRNSGAVQHPYDAVFATLHHATLPIYRELADSDPDFHFPAEPDGLLLVTTDEAEALRVTTELKAANPELRPAFIGAAEMRRVEPAMADGVAAVQLATGYAVAPGAATRSFARRAEQAGADVRLGQVAMLEDTRKVAGSVLVAAGPWSVDLVPGWSQQPPIVRRWGVVATIELPAPPRRILEELSIDAAGSAEPFAFSLVTADGASSLGSTFLADEPEPDALVARLVAGGARFIPDVAHARVWGARACARPAAFDGRPLIGPVDGQARLFVCAGHGPWGISTGPASARLVADLILGQPEAVLPPELAATRYRAGSTVEAR